MNAQELPPELVAAARAAVAAEREGEGIEGCKAMRHAWRCFSVTMAAGVADTLDEDAVQKILVIAGCAAAFRCGADPVSLLDFIALVTGRSRADTQAEIDRRAEELDRHMRELGATQLRLN